MRSTVKDVMTTRVIWVSPPVIVRPEDTVEHAARLTQKGPKR